MKGTWCYALLAAMPVWLVTTSGCSEEAQDKLVRLGSRGAAVAELRSYLEVYGYLSNEEAGGDDRMLFDDKLEQALLLFQSWHGLPEDGTLNPSTEELMKQPRCQLPDVEAVDASAKQGTSAHFTLSGRKWPNNSSIAYSISLVESADNPPGSLLINGVHEALQAWRPAFKAGGLSEGFPFYEVARSDTIRFLSAPIDGSGKVLAYASFPPGGNVVFDSAEIWTSDPAAPGIDFIATAVHEIGHALGLAHSSDRNAVMYPYLVNSRRVPTDDDQRGIRRMYLTADPIRVIQRYCRGKNAIEWDAVNGVTHYELYRSTAANFNAAELVYSGRLNIFEADLPLGTTWYFRARACKDVFCTDLSEQVSPSYYSGPCQLDAGVTR